MREGAALALGEHQRAIEQALAELLAPDCAAQPVLAEAMRYAVMGGGKRLRPLLAFAAAEVFGVPAARAIVPACALELIHSYSLIHDDLPAMDDDALRRGRATCHIRFGEALAILAGDALQALAFELVAKDARLQVEAGQRLHMLSLLAAASGAQGMVGGQGLDIQAAGQLQEEAQLAQMHRLKTGALIRASVLLGALSSGQANAEDELRLGRFADTLGLAFQVQDDILDVTADTDTLGKTSGRDAALDKPTYVSLLGLAGAQQRCQELLQAAEAELAPYGGRADGLRQLAHHIGQRRH